jgi:multiple sugar transport system substrate-binding protein
MPHPLSTSSVSRRSLLRAGLAGVGLAALAPSLGACAAKTSSSSGGADQLSMWWWGQQNYDGQGKVLDALLADYGKTGDVPSVKHVLQGTDETIPAYETAAQAKKGPDIATLWYGAYMFPSVWKGNVEPLTGLIPASETDHWLDAKYSVYDDKLYASGICGDGAAILYNKDHFREAGLDPDAPPTTWADLITSVKALRKAGFTPFGAGVKDGWFGVVFMNFVVPQRAGGSPARLLIDATSGRTSWTDPQLADLWERLAELRDARAFNENVTSLDYFEGRQEFSSNTATMTFSGSIPAALQAVRKLGPEKAGIMAAPDLEESRGGFLPGMPLTQFVTPFSGDKQAAADLLAWLHGPDAQQKMYELSDGIMMPVDDRFDFDQVEEPWLRTVYDQVRDSMERGIPYADGIVPYDILSAGPMQATTLSFTEREDPAAAAKRCQEAADNWRKLNPDIVGLYSEWQV